jgi:hypothetical protein
MRIEEEVTCWLLLLAVLHDQRAVLLGATRLGRRATAVPLGAGWLAGRWAPACRGGACATVLNEGGGATGRRPWARDVGDRAVPAQSKGGATGGARA